MSKSKKTAGKTAQAPKGNEEQVELTVGQKMAQTLRKHRANYQPVKAYSGKPSLDNGGDLAVALRGLSPEAVIGLAERVLDGVDEGELAERYAARNPGQKRMNAGNLIRNAIKRNELTVKDVIKAIGK